MSAGNWLVWVVTETTKYFIISHGIFGFEQRKSKFRFLVFFFLAIGIPLIYFGYFDELYVTSFWGIIFVLSYFYGRLGKKVQAALLQFLVITAVDTTIGNVLWLMFGTEPRNRVIDMISEVAGLLFWYGIFYGVRKYCSSVRQLFLLLPVQYYVMIICVILGVGFISANAFADVMGEKKENMNTVAYIISDLVFVLMIVCGIMLIRIVCSWRQLQVEKEYDRKIFEAQKRYYEAIQQKSDEMRQFRHDVKRHIAALQVLYREGKIERFGQYVRDLNEQIHETDIVHTGNRIVDYFVNELIFDFRDETNFTYDITGKFSDSLSLSDSDLCVLFGNAVDNSREALRKCESRRTFQLTIKNYQGIMFARICNTAKQKQGELLAMDKNDGEEHGFGTQNMRYVVEKYGGSIRWNYENGMVVVEMEV